MKTWIKALGIAGLLTSAVALADAVIFSGNDVKTLKPNIDLYGQGKILSGSVDPTSVATSAPVGSIYLNTSNGNLYRKVDAGSSTNWQKVGSAAVAGNLLPNPDWETSSSGWTASAGTYARTTTAADVGFGAGSGSWDASASSQTLTSTAVAIPTGLYAANGLARCYFKTTATDYVLQAYDGTNVLASASIPASTQYQQYGVNFPFPSSGSVSLRVVSASDAAVIYMDDCYVGPAANLQSVNQAQMIGSLTWAGGAGRDWIVTTSSWGTDFPSDPDFAAPTATGSITAVSSGVPQAQLVNAAPGKYLVTVVGGFFGSPFAGANVTDCRIVDDLGNQIAQVSSRATVADVYYPLNMSGAVEYTTAGNRTWKVQCQNSGSSAAIGLADSERSFAFNVYRFPSTSELAYRPDQVAWRVDANISGATIGLGTGAVSSYSEITNGSLSLTQNAGSISTQIACASGTASSGTTCTAANESVGVVFNAPTAGDVLACVSFTHNGQGTGGGEVITAFQIMETTNTSSAFIQEGKSRIASGGGPTTVLKNPLRVCGTFTFASAGQKTLRLQYEQAGSINVSEIGADQNPAVGQWDIHWEVYPITQAIPAPLLVGSVTSNSSGLERVERIRVGSACASSPCTITSQSGSWVNSVTRLGTGQYRLEIASGIFSQIPTCMCVTDDGATNLSRIVCEPSTTAGARSTTQYSFFTLTSNTGSNQDASFQLMCMGPR